MIRQNFYQGQRVNPNDLNGLQDYSDTGINNMVKDIVGMGVIYGFEVTHNEGHIVNVSAGLTYGKNGERLFLKQSTTVDLGTHSPSGGDTKSIKLGIKFDHTESDFVEDSLGKEVHTKETPTVEFVSGLSLDLDALEIAVIELSSSSAVVTNTAIKITTILQQNVELNQLADTVTNNKDDIDGEMNTLASTVTENKSEIDNHVNSMMRKNGSETAIIGSPVKINDTQLELLILNISHPVNSSYTQYPNDSGFFDETETPLAIFGGDWELVKTLLVDNTPTKIDVSAKNMTCEILVYPSGTATIMTSGSISDADYTQTFTLPFSLWLGKNQRGTILVTSFKEGMPNSPCSITGNYRGISVDIDNDNNGTSFLGLYSGDTWNIIKVFTRDPSLPYTPTAKEEKNYAKIWKRI